MLYTLSILLLGCVGYIHSPPSCIKYALRGIRSFAALPKSKLVRVYTLSILLLGGVGCIHSPPLRTFSARRGIRSFAALPKNKLVRVYIRCAEKHHEQFCKKVLYLVLERMLSIEKYGFHFQNTHVLKNRGIESWFSENFAIWYERLLGNKMIFRYY